jgi:exonuclease VII large subunit
MVEREGTAVRSAADLRPGDRFTVHLHDGHRRATVDDAETGDGT